MAWRTRMAAREIARSPEISRPLLGIRNLTRRVLIVSPHFPPINAPDHQRIRMSLPHFAEFGWEPTVLAVSPEYVEAVEDRSLLRTVPESTRVIRTRAFPVKQTRHLGVGNLGLRAPSAAAND